MKTSFQEWTPLRSATGTAHPQTPPKGFASLADLLFLFTELIFISWSVLERFGDVVFGDGVIIL